MRPTCSPDRSSETISNSGLRKCSPLESSLTSPNTTTVVCGWMMSARYGWFIHEQRMPPLASPSTAWKMRKPRRRVVATCALLISPNTAALVPGRSEAIGCMRLRSSYRNGSR